MEATAEFIRTKRHTDELTNRFVEYLEIRNGGKWHSVYQADFGPTDYAIYKDDILQFYIEVKTRRHNRGYYAEEKVPISKIGFAYLSEEVFKVKAYYLIEWADEEVGIIDLKKYSQFKVMVARYDRGTDTDWYGIYKYQDFKILGRL